MRTLFQRIDDNTIADIAADQVYTGALNDGGDILRLLDPTGPEVDTACAAGSVLALVTPPAAAARAAWTHTPDCLSDAWLCARSDPGRAAARRR